MNDKAFLDSNIIIYTYSNTEFDKQKVARNLITTTNSFISTQVLQEVSNILARKFKLSYQITTTAIEECCNNSQLHVNTKATIIQACNVADRYGFSFYDSLIIAAALECDCNKLYSEDLQSGQTIFSKLTIENPFR